MSLNRIIPVLITGLLLIWQPTVHAQSGQTGTITGRVVDAETREPLVFANVTVEHTTIGTFTNTQGEDRLLNLQAGETHIVATVIGYKEGHQVVTVRAGQTDSLNFALEQTIMEIGTVVVTGTATPHLLEDTPVRTEVIPRILIERRQAPNLAEALSFHTGVRVENNCQNCNFSQVRILGMQGKYSQILIDGDPVVSSLASVYGLEHFPEEMVDQIEIVKGGGSALYGAGAVAGVINMITRRPMTNQVRIQYRHHSTGGIPDPHLSAVAETVNSTGTSGAYVFGSTRRRSPYDHNGDGYSELGSLKNESVGFKLYYKPRPESEFLVSYHHIHEERRGGNMFDLPVHEADIAEWIEHWRSGGSIRWAQRTGPAFDYRLYYSYSIINRRSYFGGLDGETPEDQLNALTFYGKSDNPLHLVGMQANYLIGAHLLTFGSQYSYDGLTDRTAAETAYYIDDAYSNTGLFVQDNLHIGPEKEIEFVFGLRLDKHSELSDWIISPRVNGKFDLGGGFLLRGAYTTGFKPPQTYSEDLHLCGLEGDQRIIRNAAELSEERSNTISTGVEYLGRLKDMPAMASLTVFRTHMDDSFTERFVATRGNIELWERVNSDGAGVRGTELDVGIRPSAGVELRGGCTYIHSRYDSPHEDFGTKRFLRSPDLTANLQLYLHPFNRIECFAAGTFIGEADVPHEVAVEGQEDPELCLERSSSFVQIDTGLTYRLPLDRGMEMKINLGIKNITNTYQKDLDRGRSRDPAYVYGPTRPRTLYFGFETSF